MEIKFLMIFTLSFICLVECLPTVYKYNENKILEPDLVPVSSTVIPLPVYQVSYGLHVNQDVKNEKTKKPEEPITLITVKNKQKPFVVLKPKTNDISKVKEVTKKEFHN